MELIFATNNSHKLEEIRAAAGDSFQIISLSDAGITTEIPEEFDNLEDNARQKSEFIYQLTGKNTFADDTGLEVYSLYNKPGVFSARYASMAEKVYTAETVSEANIMRLLEEMEGFTNRQARFRTVISLIIEGEKFLFEGIVEGEILSEPRGKQGFGYDPVFQPEGYRESFAEMDLTEKNRISHRAIATAKLIHHLKKY